MEYVNLGRTGLRVSRLCLGMMSYGRHESREWALPEEEAEPIVRRAAEVAGERGVPTAQVALAWLLHRPGVTAPIVGATRPEHLADALAAEQLSLAADELARLEEPYVPHAIAGH